METGENQRQVSTGSSLEISQTARDSTPTTPATAGLYAKLKIKTKTKKAAHATNQNSNRTYHV